MSRLAGEPLARTFGVIGLCVAVLASVLDPPRDLHLSGVSFAIACMACGGWIMGRLRAWNHVALASVFVGWMLALGVAPYWRSIKSDHGVVWALVIIPAGVAAIAFVGRGVGRAVPFSILDRSARRALVAIAAAAIGFVAWATLSAGTDEAFVPLFIGAGALVTAGLMLSSDVRASLHVRKAMDVADFGAGERRVERREEVPASYRTTAVVVRVENHARHHALRWLGRVIAVDCIAVAIAATAFVASTRIAMAIQPPHPTAMVTTAKHLVDHPRPCVSAPKR